MQILQRCLVAFLKTASSLCSPEIISNFIFIQKVISCTFVSSTFFSPLHTQLSHQHYNSGSCRDKERPFHWNSCNPWHGRRRGRRLWVAFFCIQFYENEKSRQRNANESKKISGGIILMSVILHSDGHLTSGWMPRTDRACFLCFC